VALHSSIHEVAKTFSRNYACCGRIHADLHVLLRHYEDCHVQVRLDASDPSVSQWADLQRETLGQMNLSPFDDSVVYLSMKGDCEMEMLSPWKRARTREYDESDTEIVTIAPRQLVSVPSRQRGARPYTAVGVAGVNASGQVIQYGNVGRPPLVNADGVVEKRYVCHVQGCAKAYKNPNGLKYHSRVAHAADPAKKVRLQAALGAKRVLRKRARPVYIESSQQGHA